MIYLIIDIYKYKMYLICKKGCNLMLKQKWAKLHHEIFYYCFCERYRLYMGYTKYGNKKLLCRVCVEGIITHYCNVCCAIEL